MFLTCAVSLKLVDEPPETPDVASSFLEEPVILSDATQGVVTPRHGASLLEESAQSTSTRTRQAFMENMLGAQQSALFSQEQAIEQIAAQQASLAQQQADLKRREAKVEAEITKKLAGASFSQTGESSTSRIGIRAQARSMGEWLQKDWKAQLLFVALWLVATMFFGWAYGSYCTYEYPPLRIDPMVTRQNFSFGICDGYRCDPDVRICCFSHFCLPIRWADTASSPKVDFATFWTGLFIYTLAAALSGLSYGITGIICLALAVSNRQQIRKKYGMPSGTFGTFLADIAVWICCMPCAAMQEALEVEFVDPQDAIVHSSMRKVMQQTMGRSDADRFLANRKPDRQNTCC